MGRNLEFCVIEPCPALELLLKNESLWLVLQLKSSPCIQLHLTNRNRGFGILLGQNPSSSIDYCYQELALILIQPWPCIVNTWGIRVLGSSVCVVTTADMRSRWVAVGAAACRPTGSRVTGHPASRRPSAVFCAATSSVVVVHDYHFFAWVTKTDFVILIMYN